MVQRKKVPRDRLLGKIDDQGGKVKHSQEVRPKPFYPRVPRIYQGEVVFSVGLEALTGVARLLKSRWTAPGHVLDGPGEPQRALSV